MIFLSTLLRQSVYDIEGQRLGTVRDICVALQETFPVVTALVIHSVGAGANSMIIPWSQIHTIEEAPIHLTVKQPQITTYTPHSDELLLKRDILDKQIVDTQGFRVVKVNDLKLAQLKGTARLIGVDISASGLLRRLGLLSPLEFLSTIIPFRLSERTITWNYVEPIEVVRAGATGQLALAGVGGGGGRANIGTSGIVPAVQLNVSHTKLADLHPADIADILEQLDIEDAGAMLERLDAETAADTLNEVESPLQSEILSELDPERASDLLEMLPPDDAADILADMSYADAERLLNLMPLEESRPIRDLLRYDEKTAGGIMTSEVLGLSQTLTAAEALAYLREHSKHMEMIYYLYIVDDEHKLVGVVSLRELVTAESSTPLHALMDSDIISVHVDTDQEEVARLIAKYDLLGVPVLNADNQLVGLVTVDDVIDVIREEQAEDFSEIAGASVEEFEEEEKFSWRSALKRVSWLGVNVVAGFILALALYRLFGPALTASVAQMPATGIAQALRSPIALNGLICMLPLMLLASGSTGTQALGVAGWQLRSTRGNDFWRGIFRELRLGTLGGILASIVVWLLTWVLFHSFQLGIAIGIGLGFTLLIAAVLGLALPTLFQRLRLRGSLISAPLLDPIIAMISVGIFLLLTLWLVGLLHV